VVDKPLYLNWFLSVVLHVTYWVDVLWKVAVKLVILLGLIRKISRFYRYST
jgi:hypothetical protein